MPSDRAEVRELKPRQEGRVTSNAGNEQSELVRSERNHNRVTAKRIAASEAGRCLPVLRQAVFEVEFGQQMRHMAAFAGDTKVEDELKQVLEELAQAAAA
jgi:hypothetical protein